MKESMMKNLVSVCIQMNKLIVILPLFLLSMCSDAPVTPPVGACSLPLDGSPANCPDWDQELIKLPREELRGEVDIYDPMHWHSINPVSYTHLTLPTKRIV